MQFGELVDGAANGTVEARPVRAHTYVVIEHLKDKVVAGEQTATPQNRIERAHVLQHAAVVVHGVHVDKVDRLASKSLYRDLRKLLVQRDLVFTFGEEEEKKPLSKLDFKNQTVQFLDFGLFFNI